MQNKLDEYLKTNNVFIAYPNIDPDSKEYATIRLQGFGASDCAALLGVSKYGTKEDLIRDKIEGNLHPEINDLAAVRKGKELEEPILLPKVEKFFGSLVIKPKHMYGMENGLRVNFDGIIEIDSDFIPTEVKYCTTFSRKNYNWSKAIENPKQEVLEPEMNKYTWNNYTIDNIAKEADHYGIPINYYCQLQQQMMFLNSDYGYMCVMDELNWKMNYFKIHSNIQLWELISHNAKVEYILLRMKRGELVVNSNVTEEEI